MIFKAPINLDKIEATKIFNVLYEIFHNDFIKTKVYLDNSIYINPQSNKKENGKELSFWHLTTRKQTYFKKENGKNKKIQERLLDYNRASRIHWIKPIIKNCVSSTNIKLFYKKETTGKKPIRLYLWAYKEDFVVILQKLGKSSSFLVTSFYITEQYKRNSFEKYFEDYTNNRNPNFIRYEWF